MSTITRWVARLAGAGLLGATAGIHADLYHDGYKYIDTIGHLFLALVIAASILCLATIAVPRKLLGLTALAGAGLQASTVIGLVVFTHATIFDFHETTQAPHYWSSIVVESLGFLILGALAIASFKPRSPAR